MVWLKLKKKEVILLITIKRNKLKLIAWIFLTISLVSGFIGLVLFFTGLESLFNIVFWFWLISLGIWLIIDPKYNIIKDLQRTWHSIKKIRKKEI